MSEKLQKVLARVGLGSRRYMEEVIQPKSGERVLDVGCGPASLLPYLPEMDYTTDRRTIQLSLTSRGREHLTAVLPAVEAQNRKALVGLTPADIAELQRMLDRIAVNLKP